jgi:hypothetical protein
MAKKPPSSPWNRRPVRKSGKKKASTAAFKKRTGVRVISNDRPRKRRYFSPSSNLIVVILIASAFLFLNYMDELGLGYTDPETGFDRRAASVLKGTITHVRDGDTFEVKGVPIRIAVLDCPENNTSEGKTATRFAKQFKGEQAICELTGKTTYDRKVGYCSIDGKPFEEIMVENTTCEYWCKYDVWNRFCSRFLPK